VSKYFEYTFLIKRIILKMYSMAIFLLFLCIFVVPAQGFAEDYADVPSKYTVYADPNLIVYDYRECAQLFSKCARDVALGRQGGNISACTTYRDECSVNDRAVIEGKVGEYFGSSFFCGKKNVVSK
jgi:hypothetical protein